MLSVGEGGTGTKRRLAVLGQPIAHSRSPTIHNAAFAALGMGEEWSYEAIEVAPEDFASRVQAMPGEGFVGANVTVPHKRAALEVADRESEVAREVGAANTLSFADGAILADNTDAEGLMSALPASAAGRRALVMGAGGAARAVVWALLREGAKVSVWNRTPERAAQLCAELGGDPLPGTRNEERGTEYDLIVNSTAVGLHGEDPFTQLPLQRDSLHGKQTVVDLVYGDTETELLRAAREAGAEVVDGLEVLVRQGAASFRIWTGKEPPLDAMREAARTA
ncbi:MAG: shikimate dehydrogenase [Actinomycetota bacterium]